MMHRHASLLIGLALVAMVATACIIRTRRPPPAQQGQPVYVEKHKPQKHKKHKDGGDHDGDHDNGNHRGHD
jgi:hypothetical protein